MDDLNDLIDAPTLATSTHRATQQVLGRLAALAAEAHSSEHVARALLAQHHSPEAVLSYLNAAHIGVSQILTTWALAARTAAASSTVNDSKA